MAGPRRACCCPEEEPPTPPCFRKFIRCDCSDPGAPNEVYTKCGTIPVVEVGDVYEFLLSGGTIEGCYQYMEDVEFVPPSVAYFVVAQHEDCDACCPTMEDCPTICCGTDGEVATCKIIGLHFELLSGATPVCEVGPVTITASVEYENVGAQDCKWSRITTPADICSDGCELDGWEGPSSTTDCIFDGGVWELSLNFAIFSLCGFAPDHGILVGTWKGGPGLNCGRGLYSFDSLLDSGLDPPFAINVISGGTAQIA